MRAFKVGVQQLDLGLVGHLFSSLFAGCHLGALALDIEAGQAAHEPGGHLVGVQFLKL